MESKHLHRGCGFVEFANTRAYFNVLKSKHTFKGVHFDCKKALNNKDRYEHDKLILEERRKIYMGDLDESYTR